MPLPELMKEIESQAFAARVMVASSNKVFFTALSSDAAFRNLVSHLEANPGDADHVLSRLRSLATAQVDYRYQNPYDAALAAYTWALEGIDQGLGSVAAEMLLSAPQTWWARQVAMEILNREPVLLTTADVTVSFGYAPFDFDTVGVASMTTSTEVGDVLGITCRSQLLESVPAEIFFSTSKLATDAIGWQVNTEVAVEAVGWEFNWWQFVLAGEVVTKVSTKTPKRHEDRIQLRLAA